MIYRFLFFVLACASAFGQFSGPVAPAANVQSVELLSQVLSRVPATNVVYVVRGRTSVGDWGAPRIVRWDPTSSATTNLGNIRGTTNGVGRWMVDWDDRDIRVWGVRGDGTTSDSAAFQAALDYVESEVNAGLSGGVIRVPDRMKILVSSTIRMRNGVSIIAASDRNADRGFPMDQTAPRFIAAPGLRAPIFEFVDYTNSAAANPRMIVLKGLVFDGNFDNQSTNDLQLVGISLRSTLAKNISIEGCSFYDTPGWSIFALDGFNAGNIRDCFLGNGIFTTVSADLKISDTDITGRTRGSLAAGTPYPPIWLGPYSQKNQFSDIMVYMGPRAEVGYDNSLRRWSVSSADDSANTITLGSTNGLFDGLPVVWRSGGALPSGVLTNQTYHVLWSGSATIQLATSSGYRTRTAVDFGTVTLSSDVLQLGEAAMLYGGGGSTVSQNAFSNLRVEDSYADLVYLDGSHDNAFSNPMFGFSYTNTGRFTKLYRGAQGNTFNGGMMAWNFPNQFGQQPDTIVEIDAESKANRFEGVRMSNASVQTVIDRNVTEPGNVWNYEEPSTMWMRGTDASFRFWDYNSAVTNSMWWNGNSVFWTLNEADPLNTYDWGFDGSNQTLEIHGATAPGLRIQGYNASSAPSLTFRNKGGTRASPSQTSASSTLGSIFFAGRDTSADTSARAAITAVTPATGWPSTTDTPAELWFAVTPDGTATRTNLLGIQGDLTSGATPLMLSVGGAAPARVYKDAVSGVLYIGAYSGSTFTTGVGVTNISGVLSGNYSPGANVTFTTNASGNVSIAASSGGGSTNGTAVSVDGALATAVNVADSSEINPTLSGTNLTLALIASSIGTNRLTAAAYDGITWHFLTNALLASNNVTITRDGATRRIMLEASGGGGSITANGTNVTAFTNSADIVLEVTGATVSPVLADDISTTTIRANELVLTNSLTAPVGGTGRSNLTANAYLAGNGTNAVSLVGPTAKALAGWNDSGTAAAVTTGVGVTNLGGVLSGNYSPGSNVTFSTNANGNVTIAATTGGGSTNGTPVSVDGASVTAANFDDGGDINFTATGTNVTGVVKADAVTLGTDTTGNYVATIAGTANEVSVSGSGSESAAVTMSLPTTIDLGGKTSFELPNAAAPTVDAFGEIAGDNDAWAASRGAVVFYDGTASTRLVGVLATDTPSNGQVPKWNTGGTITWEDVSGSAVSVDGALAAAVNFSDGSEITFTLTTTNVTAAIANDAVDYAQIQNVSAASRLLGRGSASGSGDVQEITIGSGLAMSGTSLILTNNFTDGFYAGGFLPLFAGASNFLYGDLHYRQANDIRSPMWETNTAWNAVGIQVNAGKWKVTTFNTNDFSVLEEMIEIDPTGSPTNTITILNEAFDNLFLVEPNATFNGDVEFNGNIKLGALATATTPSAGASNTLAATTAYVDRAVQVAGTNTLQVASVTIFDPDGVQAVSDAVPLLAVESTWAPNGITIKDIYLKTDASSTYSINLEEWTSPTDGSPATIETVATSSTTEAEDDGTLSDSSIATGSIVFVDLPSTAANWIQVTVTYYIK